MDSEKDFKNLIKIQEMYINMLKCKERLDHSTISIPINAFEYTFMSATSLCQLPFVLVHRNVCQSVYPFKRQQELNEVV